MMKKTKGITLISLVITIVILIILAGVAISLSLGNNGIFNKAKQATQEYANAQATEETEIAKVTNEIDSYVGGDRANLKGTVLYKLDNPTWQAVPTATCSESLSNYSTVRIDFIDCWWDARTDSDIVTYGDVNNIVGSVWLESEDFSRNIKINNCYANWYCYNIFAINNNQITFEKALNDVYNGSTNSNQTANVYTVIGYK